MAMTEKEVAALQAEITRLQLALAESEGKRSDAEESARLAAGANALMGSMDEQPTGETIKVRICTNPSEKKIEKHVYKEVDVPTYYFTLDLPPGAGTDLSTNGEAYYHGQTYIVDYYTMVELKSRVARCWDHEKSIHGGDENAYRRQTKRHFMSKAAMQRMGLA